MIRLFKKKKKIEFYDSIEELPYKNYMKFNKEMMRQNEVGHNFGDVKKRIERSINFIVSGFPDKAIKELNNSLLTLAYSENEINPSGLALATIVKSIDGEKIEDLSSDGLQETLKILTDLGITQKEIETTALKVKKKLKPN
jgi:superfamily I DNA/RNA helicase